MAEHPWLKKWLLRTGIALGLIMFLLLGAAGAHYLYAQQKLKSVCKQLRQDSIPLTWDELYGLFPNIEAHLAAQPQFFAALDTLANHPSLYTLEDGKKVHRPPYTPELEEKTTPCMIDHLDKYLSPVALELEAIRKAVAAEPFWLVPPKGSYDGSFGTRTIQLTNAARQFYWTAILHAERDEPQAAIQAVIDLFRLAEVPRRGSHVTDEIIRFGKEKHALMSLEYVLAKTDPPRKALFEIQTLLSNHSDARNGILGEIVYARQRFADMSNFSLLAANIHERNLSWSWREQAITLSQIYSGWIRINEAYTLELLHRVVDNWDLNWQEFSNLHEQAYAAIPWFYLVYDSSFMLKFLELRTAGAWSCGRIAVAIELYSQKHGKLPAALADLVPEYLEEIPSEPFYGKPFMYEHDGSSGRLSFAYPAWGEDDRQKSGTYTFKVYANRESITIKE